MGVSNDYEGFLSALRRSGLVNEELLSRIIEDRQAICGPDLSPEAKLEDLVTILLGHTILTSWQCGKLMIGKHKGFFIGDYELRDYLGKHTERHDVEAYLARDVQDGMLEVVLEFENFRRDVESRHEPKFLVTYQRRISHTPV